MGSSPAFSFYAKDFLTGTATMTLGEVGAYVKLLAYQWDSGAVPKSARERARILGCTAAQERAVWSTLVSKFTLVEPGYQNYRLEAERHKQADRRKKLAENGSKGGSKKVANATKLLDQKLPQKGGQESSLAFSSSFSEKDHNTHTARANGHGNGANPPGSLPRDHRFHAICGPRMRVCLTEATAAKLAEKWGGSPDDAMPHLRDFCAWLEERIGEGAKGDYLWLIQHFESFMESRGRVPVAPPPKSKTTKDAGIGAAIDAWGRDEQI